MTEPKDLRGRIQDEIKGDLLEEIARRVREGSQEIDPSTRAKLLVERHKNFFHVQHEFKPNQLVKWKEGLKNRRRPKYGDPAIVVKVLDVPIFDDDNTPSSSYFKEPLDIQLGIIDPEGDFMLYHYDKRRFEPY